MTTLFISAFVLGLVFNSIETSSREYYYFKYPEYYSNDKVAQK